MFLKFLYYSNNVECAGICLSREDCYAFEFGSLQCKLMHQPNTTFDIETANGKMSICLDHKNWNPMSVYADNNNIPPMCPSNFCLMIISLYYIRN